jgi:hypothetical protein
MQLIAIMCPIICMSVTNLVIIFRHNYVCMLYVSQRKCAENTFITEESTRHVKQQQMGLI